MGAAPNLTDTLPSFEAPTNWADNYGTRMRGYITAPVTGSYTFWIASDNNSELWLSINDNPANKVSIAAVPDWTDSRQWDKYSDPKVRRPHPFDMQVSAIMWRHCKRKAAVETTLRWGGPSRANRPPRRAR